MNRRAYTLLELMIVVVLLGITAAVVAPNLRGSEPIRVQTAVRALASDIMFAQSDALAYQQRRAVVLDPASNSYWIAEVTGAELDFDTDAMYKVDGPEQRFSVSLDDLSGGAAQLISADFDGLEMIIFDELGGPVADLTSDTPASGGSLVVGGEEDRFRLRVEPYTGRVTVAREGG
ncbi:MAG: prepilin-type N-terminal cleavage/methylation domain-containing protein [Planctomycetota bacterium]